MKRVNNIYYKICNIDNIINMEHIISINTKNKIIIEKYQEYYSENIYKIKNILESKNYIPGEYNIFFIHEPKLRLIMSQNIQDKIINHLVAKYFLVDIFDKTFIDTTVATRLNKGTHLGLRVTKKYLNEMKQKYEDFYYLKFDIKKYFYNINHNIIKELIRTKIKDKDALKIIDTIIDSTDKEYINKTIIKLKENEIKKIKSSNIKESEKKVKIKEVEDVPLCNKGKGAPIGSMCSQIIAILYLDQLNHFIKEKLHIKRYLIYMDDGILIHENKDYLNYCLKEIEKYLELLKLTLNKKKTRIDSIKNGIDFLGFRFIIKNNKVIMKVRNNTKKKFKKKLKKLYILYDEEQVKFEELRCVRDSYLGHLKHGNCNNLIFNNTT